VIAAVKLLFLAALLTIVQMPPVPRQASNSSAQHSDAKKNPSNSQTPPEPAPSSPKDQKPNGNQEPGNQRGSSDTPLFVRLGDLPHVSIIKDWADWALWGASGLLAIVGIVGIIFAYKTLREVKRQAEIMEQQTRATEIAADAAKASADAVIHSERAWLLVEGFDRAYLVPIETQTSRKSVAFPNFRNYGKTVAKMIAWKMELQIGDSSERPPDEKVYDLAGLKFVPAIIPPAEPIPYAAFLNSDGGIITQQQLDDLLRKPPTKTLWLCGIIQYEDVFRPVPIHETKFCYLYETQMEGRDPFFRISGPPEVNTAS
jgi:hypothetical protein